ncbi:MAG: hypothetical protein R3270_01605 [Gammaproteobacteria bacterium]|nr:hypothetical protein [Gammaproteobacteria bacterium]
MKHPRPPASIDAGFINQDEHPPAISMPDESTHLRRHAQQCCVDGSTQQDEACEYCQVVEYGLGTKNGQR